MTDQVNRRQVSFTGMALRYAMGVVTLPFAVLSQPARVLRFGSFAGAHEVRLSEAAHRHRVVFETVEETESSAAHWAVQAEIRGLVAMQNWAELCVRIEGLDMERAACPAKRRLAHTALDTAIEALEGSLNAEGLRINAAIVAQVIEASLGSLGGCVLAARILISNCEDLEGTEGGRARMDAKMDEALYFLQAVEDEASGIVPLTQVRALAFLTEMSAVRADWYKRAAQADPEDMTTAAFMGAALAQEAQGDFAALETGAKEVADWSAEAAGMAAYAVAFNAAMDIAPEALEALDLEAYRQGLADLLTLRGSGPDHVGRLCSMLSAIAAAERPAGARDAQLWAEKTQALQEMAFALLKAHLVAIHPGSWTGGEEAALDMISEAMAPELSEGCDLVIGPMGIEAYLPQQRAA